MSKTDILKPERSGSPPVDLSSEVQMRLKYVGHWVAWTTNGRQIVAAGDTPEAVRAAATLAGAARFVLDWIPPLDERSAGA